MLYSLTPRLLYDHQFSLMYTTMMKSRHRPWKLHSKVIILNCCRSWYIVHPNIIPWKLWFPLITLHKRKKYMRHSNVQIFQVTVTETLSCKDTALFLFIALNHTHKMNRKHEQLADEGFVLVSRENWVSRHTPFHYSLLLSEMSPYLTPS